MTDRRLHDVLRSLGLDSYAELLEPYAKLEIGLVLTDDKPQASRIGGGPDLPKDLEWPAHRWPLSEVEGWPDDARAAVDVSRGRGEVWAEADHLVMPITFILQVDLATTDHRDPRIPRDGMLVFFAAVATDIPDPLFAKRIASAVLYVEAGQSLVRRPHPPTVDAGPTSARGLRAEPSIRWNLPYEELPRLEQALSKPAFASLLADARRDRHALLAAASEECTGPMPPDGEVALLRAHDDDSVGFCVGDASWVTFSISELDLRVRSFEGVRASVYIG